MVVPIYKEKNNVNNGGSYRETKLLEHALKIVERIFKKRLRDIVNLDQIQFGFIPGKKQLMLFLCQKE